MRTLMPLLVALSLFACEREAPEPDKSAEVAPTETTPVKEEPDPEPVELEPAIAEADVRALFDTWLGAQNEGDFDKYASTYAEKFEGIKRVGPRMYRYDREGWLKDRGRMFKKKMTVTSKDLRIDATPTMAVVVFEQTWASGTYKDTGPKQLIISKTPAGLRISREEMLASHVDGQANARPTYDPQALALLVDDGVVLDISPKRAWEKGPAKLISRPYTASKELDVEASGYGGWIDREMELFDETGTPCTSTITELELRVRVVPHFGTINWWNGEAEGAGQPRRSDAYVAAEIWEMGANHQYDPSTSGVMLVGKFHDPKKCKDALWARPKGGQTTPLKAAVLLQGPELQKAVDAFTDLPGYHTTQADYDGYGHHGPWHEDKDAQVAFTKFDDWIVGSARAGWGCGDFEGGFWAFWKRSDQDTLVLQSDEENPGIWNVNPKAAAKVGDEVYFIEPERIIGKAGDSWQLLWNITPANFDCGC